LQLPEDDRGYKVTGNNEKYIHPDKSALERAKAVYGYTCVIEYYRHHSDSSESVYFGSVFNRHLPAYPGIIGEQQENSHHLDSNHTETEQGLGLVRQQHTILSTSRGMPVQHFARIQPHYTLKNPPSASAVKISTAVADRDQMPVLQPTCSIHPD